VGIERLKALTISRKLKRGYHADGGGLYLQVSATSTKSWVFRFRVRSGDPKERRLREMGLGSLDAVSLAEARDAARACRKQLQGGLDPILARKDGRKAAALEASQAMTFKDCADAYVTAHKPSWSNKKHAQQWSATLATYVEPVFGSHLVKNVDTAAIMLVLDPIWHGKRETASRLRGRIEAILDWATARGYRQGENPARWKGGVEKLLPARTKSTKVKHHSALPYSELPNFIKALRAQPGVAAAALEFAVLTAARTSEVIGATWSEINFEKRMWIVPEGRMKAGREHRVPLSQAALGVLKRMEKLRNGDALFPSSSKTTHLSNMALLSVLKRMGRTDLTAHGFRSTFRDWTAECTDTTREVAEIALAHSVGNAVEAAYRRGDLFEKRRGLMASWAEFCDKPQVCSVLQAANNG
jgi:integrase